MKVQNILTLGSVLGLALFAGQASADVAGYTSNTDDTHNRNITAPRWLDLFRARGRQPTKTCFFRQGNAAVFFSAETQKQSGANTGWLETRIWIDPPGVGPGRNPFWLAPTGDGGFAMDSAAGGDQYESHAVHGGFRAIVTGNYRVRVWARSSTNGTRYRVDDLSLICMN